MTTTKTTKDPRPIDENNHVRFDGEENDDASGSSESSVDDDVENSTVSPSPTQTDANDDTVGARRIRQRALELLRAIPDDERRRRRVVNDDDPPSSSSDDVVRVVVDAATTRARPVASSPHGGNCAENEARRGRIVYRSYHDSHCDDDDIAAARGVGPTIATTPSRRVDGRGDGVDRGGKDYDDDYDGSVGLTLYDVAGMALSCVATCLTEGYRAASNYYGGDNEEERVWGGGVDARYPSVDDSGYSRHEKERTSGDGMHHYGDGYRRHCVGNDGQVMDRGDGGMLTRLVDNERSGQSSSSGEAVATVVETTTKRDEWEKVRVPSTYQGGRGGW
jgi:hypothetical protein